MCVIFLAYKVHPEYPLVLLANRDEFYDRPTQPAHQWDESPEIFAGRDLVHGGTWLGITRSGRFAAVTNYRDPAAPAGRLSRGSLVTDFLKETVGPEEYLENIRQRARDFSGFNLIVGEIGGDRSSAAYFSNRAEEVRILEPGIYGLSNHLLDTPWHKVRRGKQFLEEVVMSGEVCREKLFEFLSDKTLADDADLPETGIGREFEKLLSPVFIETPVYGTRCSSVVLFRRDGKADLAERVFR